MNKVATGGGTALVGSSDLKGRLSHDVMDSLLLQAVKPTLG